MFPYDKQSKLKLVFCSISSKGGGLTQNMKVETCWSTFRCYCCWAPTGSVKHLKATCLAACACTQAFIVTGVVTIDSLLDLRYAALGDHGEAVSIVRMRALRFVAASHFCLRDPKRRDCTLLAQVRAKGSMRLVANTDRTTLCSNSHRAGGHGALGG